MKQAGVLGTGLIGTSIALGLKQAGWAVNGWDPSPTTVGALDALDAFSMVTATADGAIAGADLVVVPGPPASVPGVLAGLATGALVTDVAGVKAGIPGAAAHLAHYVSGHPMAGRETSGPEAASASLFRGAAWVLITVGASETDLGRMEEVFALLGANPVRMGAEEHDDAVAVISHLPQVLAAALIREAMDHPAGLQLASGSFRDLTRVAASDPRLWANLLVRNAAPVGQVIASYQRRLDAWAAAVEAGDEEQLAEALGEAGRARRELAPPVVAVEVALADRPGELARVGRALESSQIDVRDLQLRHSPHGGGGILTLSVRPGEAGALQGALEAEGLLLA